MPKAHKIETAYLDILGILPDTKKEAIPAASAVSKACPTLSAEEQAAIIRTKVWQMIGEKLVERHVKDGEIYLWISRTGKQRLKERCG